MMKRNGPGCPCCGGCEITVGGWSEESGDWTFGEEISTEDSSAVAVTTNGIQPETVVDVEVWGKNDGDVLRVFIASDTDGGNSLIVEVEVDDTCGYLRLFESVSGVETQLGEDVPIVSIETETYHPLRVCYDGERLTATLTDKATLSRLAESTNTRLGLATGNVTDLAKFKGLDWQLHFDSQDAADCPLCELPCEVTSDGFTRANSTNLGCQWDETSGSWEINNNRLRCTSSGTVVNLVPFSTDDEGIGQLVAVQFFLSQFSTGDKIRVLADSDVNGSEHYAVEIETGSDKIRLYKDNALLLEKAMSGTFFGGEWTTLTICVSDGFVVGAVYAASFSQQSIGIAAERRGNPYSGVAATVSSSVIFLSFWVDRMHDFRIGSIADDCPECKATSDCGYCKDLVSPMYLQVVISGIANDDCNDCGILNQTYILPVTSFNKCDWWISFNEVDGETVPCGNEAGSRYDIYAQLIISQITWPPNPITYEYRLTVGVSISTEDVLEKYVAYFTKVWSAKPDCMDWYQEELPYRGTGGGGVIECDATGATCRVTAI